MFRKPQGAVIDEIRVEYWLAWETRRNPRSNVTPSTAQNLTRGSALKSRHLTFREGRAIAQAVSRRFPTTTGRVRSQAGFLVDKVALWQVSSPCQFSFHEILHTHLSFGAGIIQQLVADVTSGLSLMLTKIKQKENCQLCHVTLNVLAPNFPATCHATIGYHINIRLWCEGLQMCVDDLAEAFTVIESLRCTLCSCDTRHCFQYEYAYHYGLVCLVAIGLPAGCGVADLHFARCLGAWGMLTQSAA
jgi:hypothetical protein